MSQTASETDASTPAGRFAETLRLEARGLACRRGGRQVFAGVDFALGSGGGLLLEGANGSGKTSLLRLIAGLIAPDAGTIALHGGQADKSLAEQTHYVAHADAIKAQLSVAENLHFWIAYLGGGAPGRGLGAFGLDQIAELPAAFLSAGQKRKLALSRLAAVSRPLWLLDEPSVSLDKTARGALSALMEHHLARGGMIVAATHVGLDIDFADRLDMSGAPA